jgi:hypothetical protein
LPGAHARARIDWVNFDTLASQAREHARVGRPAANHFCKHRRHRRDGFVSRVHRRNQSANAIAARGRAVRY